MEKVSTLLKRARIISLAVFMAVWQLALPMFAVPKASAVMPNNGDAASMSEQSVSAGLGTGNPEVCVLSTDCAPKGQITIVKNAIPDSTQDFHFTSNIPGSESFTLDDETGSSTDAVPESATFPGLDAGTYTFTELATAGWYLDEISCPNISEKKNLQTGSLSLTIAAGQNVTCTFTNRLVPKGKVKLVKHVENNNGGTLGVNDFGLSVGGQSVTSGQELEFAAGTQVALNEVGAPGYRFVAITGDSGCPAVLGGVVTIKANTTITCTIKNDDMKTKLRLVKEVIKDNGGKATAADFVPLLNGNETTWGVHSVMPGEYTIDEIMKVQGYRKEGVSCYVSSGHKNRQPVSHPVVLELGDDVTCVVKNNDKPPVVKVKKYAGPDTEQAFDFTLKNNEALYGQFGMSHGGSYSTGSGLKAGEVSVNETVPAGWQQVQANCYNKHKGWLGTDFVAELGQVYKCEFVNEQLAEITVTKDARPDDAQDFSFTLSRFVDTCNYDLERVMPLTYLENACEQPSMARPLAVAEDENTQSFVLDDDDNATLSNHKVLSVPAGLYTITEDAVQGWSLDDITCGDVEIVERTATSITIAVAAGQKVNCTFVNTKKTTPQVLGDTDTPSPKVQAAQALADTGQATTSFNSMFAITIMAAALVTGFSRRKEEQSN